MRVSASDLVRNCAAQIRPPASCVTSTPKIITTDNRPSKEFGNSQSSTCATAGKYCRRKALGGAGNTGGGIRTSSDRRRSHIGREHITRAAHRLDQMRLLAAVVQAQAQLADLYIERAIQGAGVAPAGFFAKDIAIQYVARMLDEILQQLIIHPRQRHHLPGAIEQSTLHRIKSETDEAIKARRGGIIDTGAAMDGLDARQQLTRAVRLGDVVIGTQLQTDYAIGFVRAGGEHDDRHI